jgi:DNA-binding CsgD family transcriptional regulator
MTMSPLASRLTHAEIERFALAPAPDLRHLLETLQRAVPFDTAVMIALDPLSGWPIAIETVGVPVGAAPWIAGHPLLTGEPPTMATLLRARRHVVRLSHPAGGSLIRDPHLHAGRIAMRGSELRVVLLHKGVIWGALSLVRSPQATPFEEGDASFLESVAPLITTTLQRRALHHEADRQPPRTEHEPPGVISVHRTGAVTLLTPSARSWLQEVTAPSEHNLGAGLPDAVWLAVAALRHQPLATRPVIHVQGSTGAWITIEAYPAPTTSGSDDIMVVIGPCAAEEIVLLRERLYGLSERERAIADLVLRGWSTREIAGQLSIAESTVQGHLSHIFAKVEVRSRRGLIQRLLIDQIFPGTRHYAA